MSSIITSILIDKVDGVHLIVIVDGDFRGRPADKYLTAKKLFYIFAIAVCNAWAPSLLVWKISSLRTNLMNSAHESHKILILPKTNKNIFTNYSRDSV